MGEWEMENAQQMSSIASIFGARKLPFSICFAHKLHFGSILLAGTFAVTISRVSE